MKTRFLIFPVVLWAVSCWAQSSAPAKSASKSRSAPPAKTNAAPANNKPAPATPPPPSAPAINVTPLISTLSALEQSTRQTTLDLARLRIDKWKIDGSNREQAQANTQSLVNNLTNALPGMIAAARSAPTSLSAALKLYRDLNVLHDVLSAVAETAGAFGSKDEYQPLAADTQQLDASRRSLADYLENLAASQDAEVASLRGWLHTNAARAAAANAVTRRIIDADDAEPTKKPVRKKNPSSPAQSASPGVAKSQ